MLQGGISGNRKEWEVGFAYLFGQTLRRILGKASHGWIEFATLCHELCVSICSQMLINTDENIHNIIVIMLRSGTPNLEGEVGFIKTGIREVISGNKYIGREAYDPCLCHIHVPI